MVARTRTTIHDVVSYEVTTEKHSCEGGSIFWATDIIIRDSEGNKHTVVAFSKNPIHPIHDFHLVKIGEENVG